MRAPAWPRWRLFRSSLILVFGTTLWAGVAQADDKSGCKTDVIGIAQVKTVIDGRTLQLTDAFGQGCG